MDSRLTSLKNTVDLWSIYLPDVQSELAHARMTLHQHEIVRAEKFIKPADRDHSILCRGLLRKILANYLRITPKSLCFEHNENGKPFLKESPLFFNVSHSHHRLLIAVTMEGEIGVDIEFCRTDIHPDAISARWFSTEEQEFLQSAENKPEVCFTIWSKKEAYIKAQGLGIFHDLQSFSVPLGEKSGVSIKAHPEQDPSDTNKPWFFQTLEIDPAYAAALVSGSPIQSIRKRTHE